jgi:hypothetical protein
LWLVPPKGVAEEQPTADRGARQECAGCRGDLGQGGEGIADWHYGLVVGDLVSWAGWPRVLDQAHDRVCRCRYQVDRRVCRRVDLGEADDEQPAVTALPVTRCSPSTWSAARASRQTAVIGVAFATLKPASAARLGSCRPRAGLRMTWSVM